jgi:hypothetical protein
MIRPTALTVGEWENEQIALLPSSLTRSPTLHTAASGVYAAGIGFAIPVDEVNRVVPRLIHPAR